MIFACYFKSSSNSDVRSFRKGILRATARTSRRTTASVGIAKRRAIRSKTVRRGRPVKTTENAATAKKKAIWSRIARRNRPTTANAGAAAKKDTRASSARTRRKEKKVS